MRVDLYERERDEGTHRVYEVTVRGTFPNGGTVSAGASFSYAVWHEDGFVRLGKANARRGAIESALGEEVRGG